MKFLRFLHENNASYGVLEGETVYEIEGSTYQGSYEKTGRTFGVDAITFLPPCEPSKIVAVGLNYRGHAAEMKEDLPDVPKLFLKPPSSLIGHKGTIIKPEMAAQVDYEAELAVVIGKTASKISADEAPAHIFGYTCLNDVTARDLQALDGQWTRAKGFDTFCPLGPWIETALDPLGAAVRLLKNGRVMQEDTTRSFIFNVYEAVSFISRVMTLLPGDIITTGTPEGIGPMEDGDCVSVSIEGIGTLTNYFKGDRAT